MKGESVLFAGDTLRYDGKEISGAPEQFTMDMSKLRESIVKASALEFDIMLPGHGEALRPNASEKIKRYLG